MYQNASFYLALQQIRNLEGSKVKLKLWAGIHERSYPGLRLKVETFVSSFCPAKTFVLGLVVFTKHLRLVLGLAKGSTFRLVGSGLKFCKEDLNMAAINFSPLQNLKWL